MDTLYKKSVLKIKNGKPSKEEWLKSMRRLL